MNENFTLKCTGIIWLQTNKKLYSHSNQKSIENLSQIKTLNKKIVSSFISCHSYNDEAKDNYAFKRTDNQKTYQSKT